MDWKDYTVGTWIRNTQTDMIALIIDIDNGIQVLEPGYGVFYWDMSWDLEQIDHPTDSDTLEQYLTWKLSR